MGCHRFRIDLFEKSLNKRIWWWWRWWIMVWSPEKSTAILIPVSCVSVCGGPTLEIPNQIPHTPWGKMELKSAQFHGFYHFSKNNKIDQNIRTQKCDFLSTWFWVGSYNESYSAVSTIVNDIEFSRDHVKGPERPNLKNSYLKTSKTWMMMMHARISEEGRTWGNPKLVLFAAHTLYSKCECEYADFDVPVFAHWSSTYKTLLFKLCRII